MTHQGYQGDRSESLYKISYKNIGHIHVMVGPFVCERCGYSTNIKCNLSNHYKRKIPCEPVNSNKTIQEIVDDQSTTKETLSSKHYCEYCGKPFGSRQGKYQHKKFCKVLSNNANIPICQNMAEPPPKHQEPPSIVRDDDDINILKNKMDILINELSSLKDTAKTTHININITNNNTFILNTFNGVNTSFLNSTIMTKLMSKTYFQQLYDSLKEIVHLVYYNEKHPENHSIYIPNVRDKYAKVWDGRSWMFKNRDEILTLVRNRSIEMMNDFFYDNEQLFGMMAKQHMRKWHDRYYDDNDKVFDKKTKTAVEETILSYQSIVKKTIDKYNLL